MRTDDDLIPLAIDTETDLIGPGQIAPPMMCVTFAWREDDGELKKVLLGNHPDDGALAAVRKALESDRHLLVFHNSAYDLTVFMATYPELIPAIFAALRLGRVDDTGIREKLLNLSTHGQLEDVRLPDGSSQPISYHLANLSAKYLGKDRSAQKEGDDIWRLNYCMLDGWKAADYPDEAASYALEDAADTLEVWEAQELRIRSGDGSVETSRFQCASDLPLRLMTCWGFAVDQEEVAKIEAIVEQKLAPERLDLLLKEGILRPGEAERPYINGGTNADGTPKMKAAVEPTRNMARLKEYIVGVCKRSGMMVKLTDTGYSKCQQWLVSPDDPIALEYAASDADFIDPLADIDPVLRQYQEREELSKIVQTYLPVLRGNQVVHFNFNVLVETGRTSSYGNKKGRPALYPATNGQNQPKEVRGASIRHCFIPRPGLTLWDVDYQALELACVGQTTYDLFGESTHLRLYNDGVDLHAYLAAQLALRLGRDPAARMFQQACVEEKIHTDPLAVYRAFLRCKSGLSELAKFYKHYRDFAKPTGLGFPGGLGPRTMVTFARTQYQVTITEDEARAFREVWHETYPEMAHYFKWVNKQHDPLNPSLGRQDDGREIDGLFYVTPLGMIRRAASYCDVANGKAMQSPGAEGAKLANFMVSRACYDETQGSVLFGCRPLVFVHDQIIGETTEGPTGCASALIERAHLWHEQCMEVSKLMVDAMRNVLPDVNMRTEPLLTSVWSKKAVQTYNQERRLVPWVP